MSMFENNVMVYRFVHNFHLFVTRGNDEIRLALATLLQSFYDSVTLILRLLEIFLIVENLLFHLGNL